MSEHDCCCVVPADPDPSTCPTCEANGHLVDPQTVKALLTEWALRRLDVGGYRFCANPACRTVYFADSGRTLFTVADVRVPVWQKERSGARMICYCFGENEAGIRHELEHCGVSGATQRVRDHIAAQRCACEIRNPRGACCLGDVMAAIKREEAALQAAR